MHINQRKRKLLALVIIVSIAIFVIVLWAVANTSNRSNGENGSMSIEEIVRIQKNKVISFLKKDKIIYIRTLQFRRNMPKCEV